MIRPQGTIFSLQAKMRQLVIATILFVAHLSATPACASGGEGGHHASIADIAGPWINFIVYVALLTALLRKPIKNGWAARRERIAEEVSAATSEMEAAERELAAVEALTKNIAQEQERARVEILKQGELEATSIASAAREKAARIKSQVGELLEGESRSAQASFRSSLVAKAVELSKARFQGGEFSSRQSAYVDAAVDRAKKLVR
jgi:F0F1-type ATP synthase membrane subunit b/b'